MREEKTRDQKPKKTILDIKCAVYMNFSAETRFEKKRTFSSIVINFFL